VKRYGSESLHYERADLDRLPSAWSNAFEDTGRQKAYSMTFSMSTPVSELK
jgi:hypothetical protein